MSDERLDPVAIGEGLRHRDELRRVPASPNALARPPDATRSGAEREKIDARMEKLGARAEELAELAPSLEDLLTARAQLADATNNEQFGDGLDADFPVLLLPIRLQTRFVDVAGGVELRI